MTEQQLFDFAIQNWRYVGVMVGAYFLTQYIPAAWFKFRETWLGQKIPAAGIGDFICSKQMRIATAYIWCMIGVVLMPVAEGREALGWFSNMMLAMLLGGATTNGRDLTKLIVRVVVRKIYPDDSKAELQKKIEELTDEHHETQQGLKAPSKTRSMLAAVEDHFK